jgi:hypothetical protein
MIDIQVDALQNIQEADRKKHLHALTEARLVAVFTTLDTLFSYGMAVASAPAETREFLTYLRGFLTPPLIAGILFTLKKYSDSGDLKRVKW